MGFAHHCIFGIMFVGFAWRGRHVRVTLENLN